MQSFRLLSYNIHKGMSPLNRVVTLPRMGQALMHCGFDVLCLQEVQGQNLKRIIAYDEYPECPQHEWFGEFLSLQSSYGQNASYRYGNHGNATLSSLPLDPKHNVNITVSALEQRGVLHSQIMLGTTPIVILNTHLNLLETHRSKQYQAICDYIDSAIDKDKPLVLAGDFNDWAKKSRAILAKIGLQEVFFVQHGKHPATFPAALPMISLDRIYVRHLRILDVVVHTGSPWSQLSDHLPISAQLTPL